MIFSGYEFIEVGEFRISNNPLEVVFNGQKDKVSVELKLYKDDYKNVGESVYLIKVDDIVFYVGEYSNTLENRWLRKDNYIWHNKDVKIVQELNHGKRVLFFLIVNPYVYLKDGREINISKAIEHDILQKENLEWNTRNKSLNVSGGLRLEHLL